jgi:hypothetical protein
VCSCTKNTGDCTLDLYYTTLSGKDKSVKLHFDCEKKVNVSHYDSKTLRVFADEKVVKEIKDVKSVTCRVGKPEMYYHMLRLKPMK